MSPQDQNYGAGADAAHQADTIQKQMSIEEEAAKPQEEPVDNSILAEIENDEDMKSLSDVIHEGATPATDPTPTDFASAPATPEKVKKPGSKKPLIIAIVAVVLIAAGVGAWFLISALSGGEGGGGAKADPDRMAFFVSDSDNAKFAVFNDKGDKLTDFVYDKVSDFNNAGYAVAKKADTEKYGLITNTGKLSVAYDKYTSIEAFGQYFLAVGEDENTVMIDGTGEKITDVSSTESTHGLFSVYNGSKSFIYDKEGNKVGESDTKKPLGDAVVVRSPDTVCFYYEGRMACFNEKTGDRVIDVKSETPLKIEKWSVFSNNYQCAKFINATPGSSNAIFYHYGKLTKASDAHDDGSMIISMHSSSDNCFFTDNKSVMGADYKKVATNAYLTSATVIMLDSTHYAYVHAGEGTDKYIVLHMGDDEVKLIHNKLDWPTISGGKDYIVVQYAKKFAIYKDSIKPVFELDEPNEYFSAGYTSNIDENNNIASNRYLVNTEKGIIYKSNNFGIHMTYKYGLYFIYTTYADEGEYTGVIKKDGQPLIAEGKYDSIRISDDGKFLIAKKGKDATLLDIDGKELLKEYDAFNIYKSHIEAIKDGKYEFYTRDLKKLN